jgi:hypothetical protein
MGSEKKPPMGADEAWGIVRDDADKDDTSTVKLTPELQADFNRQMKACKTAYEATDEPLAVAEALTAVYLFEQRMPTWVEAAGVSVIIDQRTAMQARRHRESMVHMQRYMYVHGFRQRDIPLEQAAERAQQVLKGTKFYASVATIIESYWKVRHDIEAGRQFEYFFLKDPRYFFADGDLD